MVATVVASTIVAASALTAAVTATPVRAAGIGYVQGTAFATGTTATSLPVQLTGTVASGDLLVGWFGEYNAPGQLTVSDNVNGAWTRGPSALSFGGGDVALYYLANSHAAAGGVTVTVTAPAAAFLQGAVGEYSGVALAGPLDQMAVASGTGTTADSGPTASIPAGDLVFGALVTGGSPTAVAPGAGYTARATTANRNAFAEDMITAAAGPQDATATLTASTDWYAVAAAFSAVPQSAQPPSAPTNLATQSVTSSHVSFSWTAATDNVPVTSYTVYHNGTQIGTTATTGFTDASVAPSTTYSYTVTASNGAAQTSAPSSPLSVTTPVAPPPSITFVQSNTVTTGTQVASTTMQLTHPVGAGDLLVGWFSLYSAAGKLQISDSLNGAWMRGPSSLAFQNDSGDIALYYKENSKAAPAGLTITVATTSGTGYLTGVVAEYSDVALAGSLDQMAAARAVNQAIDSGLTGPANTTELVYSAAMIDTPTGTQTITPGSSRGVAFTPRAQTSNLSTYEQDITAPASGPQDGTATLGASADWYAVAAVFRQLPPGVTQAPTVPSGLTAPSIAATRVALTWAAASDTSTPVTGYTVYRNGTAVGITASSTTTFVDVSTAASTTYVYSVDAFNGTGQHSAQSVGLSVVTPANSPQFIQGASVSLATRQASLSIVLPKPVLAGDLLMGWYGQYNVLGQVHVSDNVNGAWLRSTAAESFQGSGDIALEYVQNSKAAPNGITITVSAPSANAYLQEVVAQFRGVSATNALDQAVVAESNQGSAISAGPTAAVPAGELVVGAVITGGQPGTITPGASAGIPYIVDSQNGSASSDLEDVLSSTAGPQSANATLGVGGDWYMVVATFRTGTTSNSTAIPVTWSAPPNIQPSRYQVWEQDDTSGLGQWLPYVSTTATSTTFYGFQGHTYGFAVQYFTASGSSNGPPSGPTSATTTIAANATRATPFTGMYAVDGFGVLHPASSPPLASALWPGWNIARGVVSSASGEGGIVLDGFGGLHPFGDSASATATDYWPGWDIAAGIATLPGGSSGYVLDGWGNLHPFSVGGTAMPKAVTGNAFWYGWSIARGVATFSDGSGGVVLDGWGGIHPFAVSPNAQPAAATMSSYWSGWDIARSVVLMPGSSATSYSGYVLDGFGGLHSFAGGRASMPPTPSFTAYWPGWDIARSVLMVPGSSTNGYVVDGYGGFHPFGSAPAVLTPNYGADGALVHGAAAA